MRFFEPGTHQNKLRSETLAIVVFGALLLFVVFYALSLRQQALRASPSGFDGLQAWLTSEGVSTQSFLGGWQVDQNSVGLLVMPLYDTVLDNDRSHPRTKAELLFQQDEYDLNLAVVQEKILRVPTLVILPKWRSGMRLARVAHPVLLNERSAVEELLRNVTGQSAAKIVATGAAFSEFSYTAGNGQGLSAQLYAAQMFTSPDCSPIIGSSEAMVLADCSVSRGKSKAKGKRLLVLSDPDLLNNHGLRMADNSVIIRNFLREHTRERNVMIDYSRDMWLTDPKRGIHRERSWADLKRFFDPPFLTLWLGGFLTLILFVWRSWLRYGPVHDVSVTGTNGKALALQARARLMRLCDQDGALIGDYAHARLVATAAALFGPAFSRHYAEPTAFLGYVARRHPERAAALESVLTAIQSLPPRISPAEAICHVDKLEALLEQIIHDT
ncbi:hypothetical protein [Pseudovibrio sp. Tun.PSC04-5.I4]|uniref:hypothetical protein n=1 Tax=Pseudovibrio sp. Tun.PSC04-5.I4 TaxID=1798213 RepID=UPI00088E71B1|nr:hypothetical protein [Pseudovibrio sp. Tun.PSC04-5.I4]SDR19437.1 hypothetical protein SAMN04515695_3318 [Pseudovibrio sp. Tun.PSC04-5.I4]